MQVAIDFVGGDMVKTERTALLGRQLAPPGAGGFEQGVSADDVGLDERGRAVDRPVHMGLGCQVHDRPRLKAFEHGADGCRVGDIGLDEFVSGVVGDALQRFEVAGVGQLVEVEHFVFGVVDQVADQRRANEAGAACDEYAHLKWPLENQVLWHAA
ncbi:hypothetical protein D3C80_1091580 [compost metagenome]